MIDANKDEARKCIRVAKEKIKLGDKSSAKKFMLKAKRLDPSISFEDLDEISRSRSASRDRGKQGDKEETPPQSTEKVKSDATFSKSQVEAVRRVLACKDYYELLGVAKTAPEEEIKRCYRSLALKFHPDKNHAPGATEAFKKIGTAFNVLTDHDRRRRYDQFGTEEEIQRIPQAHRHGDTFFQYDADVFNMFFNGFPFSQVYQNHRQRPHRSRESERESNYFVYVQLIPLIILFGLSFFGNLFVKDPYYNLSRSNKYYVERYTESHKVLYYVKPTFEKDFTGSIEHLESQIEEEHIGNMRFRCFREKDYKENLLFRARYYGDQAAHEKAMHMSMPNCERLVEMFGG